MCLWKQYCHSYQTTCGLPMSERQPSKPLQAKWTHMISVLSQYVFRPFVFDTFGFLAVEVVNILQRVQKFMHNNVVSHRQPKRISSSACCSIVFHCCPIVFHSCVIFFRIVSIIMYLLCLNDITTYRFKVYKTLHYSIKR